MEKILLCYICKKPIETEKASFDLINNMAVHIKKTGFLQKLKTINDCSWKYIKSMSSAGREVNLKEIKIDDIFRHHKKLFIIVNEKDPLPEKKF